MTDGTVPARNRPPIVTAVQVQPPVPTKGVPLQAIVATQDPDGDPVRVRHQWRQNGADLPGASGPMLGGEFLAKGNRISVIVVPSDGRVDGEPVEAAPVIVQNTPPVVDRAEVLPSPATAATRLEANVVARDDDGDALTFTYQWIKNGQDLSGQTAKVLEPGPFKKGDQIAVTVSPDDGEERGVPLTTRNVQIQNAAPQITSAPPRGRWRGTEATTTSFRPRIRMGSHCGSPWCKAPRG